MKSSSPIEIHDLAQKFATKGESDGVVLLTRDYESAIAAYPKTAHILLLHSKKRLSVSDKRFNNLPPNVSPIDLKDLSESVLSNKVFVCINYLEKTSLHRRLFAKNVLKYLMKNSRLGILSVKESRLINKRYITRFFGRNGSLLIGRFRRHIVVIGGRLTSLKSSRYEKLPILAVVSQFNENDINEPVIEHLLSQGVDVHVIDNWSTDGSFESVQRLAKQYGPRVTYEQFPKHDTQKYEWTKILTRVTEVAKERSDKYRWIISNDSDEIRTSPWTNVSLQDAISFVDSVGFNAIEFTVFNYFPTRDGFKKGVNPTKFFKYGDFGHEGWHLMQLKAWRNHPEADLASSSGHLVSFPGIKPFPLKFMLSHYSLRSNEQAQRKIFKDRQPRFIKSEKNKGWHSHYNNLPENKSFIRDKKNLIAAPGGVVPDDYLIESISGIGIEIME